MGCYAILFYFLSGDIQLDPAYLVGRNVGWIMVLKGMYKLTAVQIKKAVKAGRYAYGNCLYLFVDDYASKRWILRLVVRGKRRGMGLGSVALVSLKEARDLAR